MTLELSLMTISGLGMIGLLIHKHLENSRGIATRLKELRTKADPTLHRVHISVSSILSKITIGSIVIFFNKIFVYVVRLFMNVSHKVHTVSSDLVEKASKKTEDLSKAGAASFYLKQIKDAKENGGDGEVKEDSIDTSSF